MFKNFSIGKRLAIGFGTLAALILVMGGFSILRMGAAQTTVREITDHEVPGIRDLGHLATGLAEYRVSERGLVSSYENPEKAAEYTAELAAGEVAYNKLADTYGKSLDTDSERKSFAEMKALSDLYFANSRKLIEGVKSGDLSAASGAGSPAISRRVGTPVPTACQTSAAWPVSRSVTSARSPGAATQLSSRHSG